MAKSKASKVLGAGWELRHCSRCGKVRPCSFTSNPYQREMMLNTDPADLPRDWYCSECLAYLHDEV
jgi:hypothetical protein